MATAEISLDDLATRVSELSEQFAWITGLVDPESTQNRVAELEQQMQLPGFWDDQTNAAKTNAEYKRLERKMQRFEQLTTKVEDLGTMIEMAREADDEEAAEIVVEVSGDANELATVLGELQEDALFTGDYDAGNAVVGIQSGEGGVDAQDFAEMLQRMYLRFWNQRDFKVTQTAQTDGDEAGIRSASFLVEGDYAYGIMNAEAGVHRLVRLSPFDSANRRHTSFAQIEVSPYIDEDVGDVEVDDADIRVDTYRASGAGGQHVNKTDSAIRITHEPTGIVVQCQNERSQHQNRDTAMKMLRSQLFELELQKREAEIAAEKGDAQNVGYGSQIRSYVLHPYQMVKDLRTKHETGNVQAVLDGALDEFVRALLLQQAQDRSEQ